MRGLDKRIAALEAATPQTGGKFDLDGLSDANLEHLEQILIRVDAAAPGCGSREAAIASLADGDLRFLASIGVMLENTDG